MSAHFFETSARSAIGLVRQGNEDSAFASAQLIAVADGMGGHAAGGVGGGLQFWDSDGFCSGSKRSATTGLGLALGQFVLGAGL